MACREQAAELRSHLDEIRGAGGGLAFVGTGAPNFAAGFREHLDLGDLPLLSDEKRESYRLLEFRRSLASTLSPRAIRNYLRAWARGFRQGRTMGDGWQQGGVIVVSPGGGLRYRYASRVGGDLAPTGEVLAALRSVS